MLVVVGSITAATKLARLIERKTAGRAWVVHTPSNINKGGCSYAVRFSERNEREIRQLISGEHIPVKGFYREDAGHADNAVS